MKPSWLDELPDAVKNSLCRSDVLRLIGLDPAGSGNHQVVQRYIDQLNLDTSHFDFRKAIALKNFGKKNSNTRLLDSDIFIENSTCSRNVLVKRCKKLLPLICSECNVTNSYNGKPISLQLDHINGINNDNRIENLRWLCPNCHSQTVTWGSKNRKGTIYVRYKRPKRDRPRKVQWPEKHELTKLLNESSWVDIGKLYGVSDNAVRKWARKYGIL
jgi:5-methylcytosine-specific restriction endonuclease McrA